MTDVFIETLKSRYPERSSLTVKTRYRANDATSTPDTIHYRVDCITTGTSIAGWTSVSAASTADISITSTQNKIISDSNASERKQITVAADKGTDTETRSVMGWKCQNIRGFNEA